MESSPPWSLPSPGSLGRGASEDFWGSEVVALKCGGLLPAKSGGQGPGRYMLPRWSWESESPLHGTGPQAQTRPGLRVWGQQGFPGPDGQWDSNRRDRGVWAAGGVGEQGSGPPNGHSRGLHGGEGSSLLCERRWKC